jgi:hypothetical protein
MPRPLDPAIAKVFKEMDMDPKEAVWDCHGTWIAYHRALERVAASRNIIFDPPQIVEANGENAVAAICVTGRLGDRTEWSIGEAAPKNNKNAYPWAMAEKRAKDRVILKLIGLHGTVYSEEEADDFKRNTPTNGAVKVKTSDVETWTGPLGKSALFKSLKNLETALRKKWEDGDIDGFMQIKSRPEAKAVMEQAAIDMPLEYTGPVEDGMPYKDYFDQMERDLMEAHPINAG